MGDVGKNHPFSRCESLVFVELPAEIASSTYGKMFLALNHQRLDVYSASSELVFECYKLCKRLPAEEKFGLISQVRRAALSVHLNVAEGSSRKSESERKRYYEIARGSIIEIDAALDMANKLNYLETLNVKDLGRAMIKCFKLITGLIKS